MELDPADILLKKARDDQRLLVLVHGAAAATDEQIGFFAQQAVEKSIKYVLTRNGVRYHRTHDLRLLIDLLGRNAISYPSEINDMVDLTPFAAELRYDDLAESSESSAPFDRVRAVEWVRIAVEWAERISPL